MDNNINDIDKFFKDRLDGFEGPNVPGAWDNMASMLDADSKGAATASKTINRFILASLAGAIVLAGSVIGYISGYDANSIATQNNINNTTIVAEAPAAENTTKSNSSSKSDKASIVDNIASSNTSNVEVAPKQPTINTTAETPTVNTTPITEIPETPTVTKKATPVKTIPTPKIVVVKKDVAPTKVIEESVERTEKASIALPFNKESYTYTTLDNKEYLDASNEGFVSIDEYINSKKLFIDSALRKERDLSNMERFYRPQFGIQAGGNFNRVLNNTSDKLELGSGIMVGLFFTHNFSKKWSANVELNYLRSTGNSISRNITQTDYFLEKTQTNFFLVTKSFHYVQMPLSVSFSPTPRHKFSVGASGMLLVNSRTDVVENREKFSEKSSNSRTENGIYEDLNSFNYGALIGYEYNLPGRYSLGLRYNQMFNSVTNNLFNDTKKHLPAHLQLYVKLNLTR